MHAFSLQETYSLVVVALCIIIALSFFSKTTRNTTTAPEASGGWPIIGHLNLFGGSSDLPHIAMASIADRFGPIFTVRLGARKVLVVSNWEVAKEIFTTHDIIVSNRPKFLAAKILGYDYASFAFSHYGPYWREIRKIISIELLSSSRLEKIKNIREFELNNSVKKLLMLWKEKRDGEGKVLVEMKQWFWEFNMDFLLRIIAGKRFTTSEGEEMMKKRRELIRQWFHYLGLFVVADALPFLRWLDFGGHEKAMKRVATELDSMVGKWLDEHRQKRDSTNDATSEKDFIDVMISAVEANNLADYDADTVIKATCLTLIAASVDTTAVMLTWTLSLLLNNPYALKKVQEELEMHTGKEINETNIKNLVYLEAVVKETFRLYPATFLGAPRTFTEDCVVGGYHVPKDTWLLMNIWKVHRDPSIWSDPLVFRPERFLTPDHKLVDVKGADFVLIPFGAGRRSCPGTGMALQTIPMVLATLLHKFEISTPNGAPVDMTASVGVTNAKANSA